MEALPPELLDRVLRATGLTAAAAHRTLPGVCSAWRAALARLAASEEPLAAPLAVACGAARALLLLDVAAPDGVGASPVCRTPRLLARFDIPLSRGVDDAGGDGYAWPTYVARAGPAADDGATPLLLCEYARAGLVRLRALRQRTAPRVALHTRLRLTPRGPLLSCADAAGRLARARRRRCDVARLHQRR